MFRLRPLAGVLAHSSRAWLTAQNSGVIAAVNAASEVSRACPSISSPTSLRGVCTSWALHFASDVEVKAEYNPALFDEPERKYRPLTDKEMWHEAWMYEDRFGSETAPILVPSLEDERIIGVTDPEDENLIVWGILKAGEPPRQFIENGEYYVLKVVPQVMKVGDVIMQLEGVGSAADAEQKPLPA